MIVRDVNGNSKVISDRYLSQVRGEGLSSLDSKEAKVSEEVLDEIVDSHESPKKVAIGSLMYSADSYGDGGGEDDTDLDEDKRKKMRRLLVENPLAFSYITDPGVEAIYQPRPLNVVRQEWQTNDKGVDAIKDWMRLFEAREGNPSLMYLAIWASQYFRHFAECIFELRYIHSEHLHLLGYKNNRMVGGIDPICPVILNDVGYNKRTGRLSYLEMEDRNGKMKQFKGAELNSFIYFHNRPNGERRGISRLRPSRRWLNGYDDLLEYNLEMFYNDARPIEHHALDDKDMLPAERQALWDEHGTQVKEAIDKKMRMVKTSDRWKIGLIGFQGRTLDSAPIIEKAKSYCHQSVRLPESFVEAKNANKATIDVQERHYQHSQLTGIDRAIALRLYDLLFKIDLREKGIDARLTPTILFPSFKTSDTLAQSFAWQTEVETFGYERMKQIAEEQGYKYDPFNIVEKRTEKTERIAASLLQRNSGS